MRMSTNLHILSALIPQHSCFSTEQAETLPKTESDGTGPDRTDAEKNAFAFFQKIAGTVCS